MFLGNNMDALSGVDLASALEQMRGMSAVAGVIADLNAFNELSTDFLVNNNGTAPLAGLVHAILRKAEVPQNQNMVETMLKVLIQINPGDFPNSSFRVKDGYAILNNVFTNTTVTAALMYGDKVLKDGVTDVNGAALGDAEKRAVRNALRILRNNPRLRHEMLCTWLTARPYEEDQMHKEFPKGGIDLFVALCLGDFIGDPEHDKNSWFANQWEFGKHAGSEAAKLTVVNDYLGYATSRWHGFNHKFGKGEICFRTADGDAIHDSRPHKLVHILGQLLPKLFAGVSPFKPAPVVEQPKPQAAAVEPIKTATELGIELPIGIAELSDEERAKHDQYNADRLYRDLTKSALNDVESFVEEYAPNYVAGVVEVQRFMKRMGVDENLRSFEPEKLAEFVKYGNPQSIGQNAARAWMTANAMAAAVRFGHM